MSRRLFGTNGYRGVVGIELTPDMAVRLGYAIGSYHRGGALAVGRDGRSSGEMLQGALISGLLGVGATVYDAGLVSTPTLQKYVLERPDLDYGVMVTASHNPPEYNGFKIIGSDGVEVPEEVERGIEEAFFSQGFAFTKWREIKEVRKIPDAGSLYMKEILKQIDLQAVRGGGRRRVVLDPGHGTAVLTVPHLLEEIDYEVMIIHGEIDGSFPHRPPEPRPDNLQALSEEVKASGSDLGVAFDGDGDRALFCDEKGKVWWGDISGIAIGAFLARKGLCKSVVTPITSSAATELTLEPLGVRVLRTVVGSRHVSYRMRKEGAIWGFEENGGGLYAPHLLARDGGMTTMLLIQLLAEEERALSEVFKEIPRLHQVKTKIRCEPEERKKVIKEFMERYGDRRQEIIDGVKIWFREDKWVLIRPSGTEPIIRIFTEAKEKGEAEAMAKDFSKEAEEILSSPKT
jgi:phosphomannomutase/phosphoglucomutase